MRRRFALGWVLLVIVLALMVPATTAASSSFRYTVLKNQCSLYGGWYGDGSVQYKVKLTERGWSGTNQFQTETYLQEAEPGGNWYDLDGPWVKTSRWFNDDYTTWSWTSVQKYSFSEYEASNFYHRLATHIEFWGNNNLISEKWLYSRSC